MSHFNPHQHFDAENWRKQKIAQRTKDALAARDAAFAEKNSGTTRAAFAQYLNVCAAALGHSPSPAEIDGGAFIEQRFGSWEAAMTAAGLPMPKVAQKLNSTLRYKQERAAQEAQFLAERRAQKKQKNIEKSLRKSQLSHEKAVKRRAEKEKEAAQAAGQEASC